MGLDVYAGGFTRFYTNDFLTPIERFASEGGGVPATVIRANRPKWMENHKKVRAEVHRWKRDITGHLRKNAGVECDWDEHHGEYFNEQLTWPAYGALMLWAAYDEHPDLMPPSIDYENWQSDPAYRKVDPRTARYAQLYDPVSIWLPGPGKFAFVIPTLEEKDTVAGFTSALLAQLRELNDRTWKVELHRADDVTTDDMASFEAFAWGCFTKFLKVTQWAVANGMPMQLDG